MHDFFSLYALFLRVTTIQNKYSYSHMKIKTITNNGIHSVDIVIRDSCVVFVRYYSTLIVYISEWKRRRENKMNYCAIEIGSGLMIWNAVWMMRLPKRVEGGGRRSTKGSGMGRFILLFFNLIWKWVKFDLLLLDCVLTVLSIYPFWY